MTALERKRLQDNFDRIPKDIKYLTKSEAELKRELCLHIEDAECFLNMQKQELQRLRREHHDNTKTLVEVTENQTETQIVLDDIQSRQSKNDQGMSTLFKLNQISCALEVQDERDKQKVFLMGHSEPVSSPVTSPTR